MQNSPVNWYEGLFLRPHHFQAADRYLADAAQTSEQWDHPYGYGLVAIDFSREALGNNQFEVRQLKARMRDGTLVSLDFGQSPDRLDLRDELAQVGKALVPDRKTRVVDTAGLGDRIEILVVRDQAALRTQPRQEQARLAAAAERCVHVG